MLQHFIGTGIGWRTFDSLCRWLLFILWHCGQYLIISHNLRYICGKYYLLEISFPVLSHSRYPDSTLDLFSVPMPQCISLIMLSCSTGSGSTFTKETERKFSAVNYFHHQIFLSSKFSVITQLHFYRNL